MSKRRISVILADDQPEVRGSLRRHFDRSRHFEVIGEAGDGMEAVEMTGHLQPDFLLLDLAMPGMDGLQALGELKEAAPATRVIVLSGMVPFHDMGNKALALGAFAVHGKLTSPKELMKEMSAALDL